MEEEATGARSPLITFSHFLPHQVLYLLLECGVRALICLMAVRCLGASCYAV